MRDRLSISKSWEETKARLAADGRLLLSVALALVALPSAIGELVAPQGYAATPASIEAFVVLVLVAAVGIIGQLAIVRLSYGSSVSVGEAIGHGLRRSPFYIAAAILIILLLAVLLVPFAVLMAASGITFQPGMRPSGPALLYILLFSLVALYLGVRFILGAPVASAENAGPLKILKRSWVLTRGHSLRLLGFVLLFLIGALICLAAINVVAGLIANLLLGGTEPMSIGALLVILVNALASAVATAILAVMITRVYVQVAGDPGTEVSVPTSGT